MATAYARYRSLSPPFISTLQHFFHSVPPLEQSLKTAIERKDFLRIPNLLSSCPQKPYPNPLSFLSSFPLEAQIKTVDEILQSLIPLRPRSLSCNTYFLLLSQFLTSSYLLPLSLAILQQYIHSGSKIPQQTHLSLSQSWLHQRCTQTIVDILSETRSIGYPPDRSTCNYLLFSLSSVDEVGEAVSILREMRKARCEPDAESYDVVIEGACRKLRTGEMAEILGEMVRMGIRPRQGTVLRVVSAMRANGEVKRAKEILVGLERDGFEVGFHSFEVLLEGCLKRKEFLLAGEVVMEMAERGLIPYIRARQRVVEGLASVDECEFASVVRQRLSELGS
ncbi:pentatricopeptide repeat-containing protein At1g06270 [Aristolochia californica]|uniref:pentatricopeptide repeat-containing protein At1g06270 n=1 Tax=Aristolochia californica TaxID=171875 RepID=UPI0035E1E05C